MGRVNQRGVTKDPLEAGSDASASDTGTAVGVQAEANGRDTLALGLLAAATAEDASALGARALAPNRWNTVLGRGAGGADNGANVTIVGRESGATGDNTTVVGETAEATADEATAVGRNASAQAAGSLALGFGSTATEPDAVAVGDRDREIDPGRGLIYQSGSTIERLANLVVDPGLNAGDEVSYDLAIGGEPFFRVKAESDGAGGIQNAVVTALKDLAVPGDTTEVQDVVTGSLSVEDGSGTAQFLVDATTSPPTLDFKGVSVVNVSRLNAEGTSVDVDGNLNVTGEVSEGQSL